LAGLGWWRPRWLPPVALAAMLLAGVVAVGSGSFTTMGSGAFSGLAQAFALVALTAALMPTVAVPTTGSTERPADLGEGAR
jgi:arabinofuranan 3-O-arabinosyltransferase